jgi:hypothetical protein
MLIKFFFFLNYTFFDAKNNVFMKNQIFIAIYVDDLIVTKSNSIAILILKRILNEQFKMSDLNFYMFYINRMIFRNRNLRKLFLDQSVYVEQIFRDHEIWNCKSLIIFTNVFVVLVVSRRYRSMFAIKSRDVTKMTKMTVPRNEISEYSNSN